ncbi:hypothetical protein ABIC28_001624 [Rhodococcus sp. PvR044]|uniref:hypothetical protein n=1 Tax=Rhodococcus sp. PvR044 TaxID=3156402 RepID=UPI00339A825D
MKGSIKVVIDGYNCINGTESVLPHGLSSSLIDLDFGRLADAIGAKFNRDVQVSEVTVHMGIANPQFHPARFQRESLRILRWERDSRVHVRARTSKFVAELGKYEEKGVDTAIALDLINAQASGRFDAVVLFGADHDHEPAFRQAFTAPGAQAVLARWDGQRGFWPHDLKPWCHYLGEEDLAVCSRLHTNRAAA